MSSAGHWEEAFQASPLLPCSLVIWSLASRDWYSDGDKPWNLHLVSGLMSPIQLTNQHENCNLWRQAGKDENEKIDHLLPLGW